MELLGIDIPLWVALAIISISLLYWYGTSTFGIFKKMGVPYLSPLPFLGNMATQMSMSFHEYDMSLQKKLGGKIYGSFQGRIPTLDIADVEFVKQLTIKDFSSFTNRRDVLNEKTAVTESLAGIKDAHWKHVRATLTPIFTSGKLKLMYSQVNQCADKLVDQVTSASSNSLAIKPFVEGYTMDVIATTAFGLDIDVQSSNDHPFIRYSKSFFGIPYKRSKLKQAFIIFSIFMIPKPLKQFLGLFMDMAFLEPESLDYFTNIVDQIFSSTPNESSEQKNFISICAEKLVDVKESEAVESTDGVMWSPKGLTKGDILANSLIFLTAGYETTASSLQFFFYNMALHPDVQEKLYDAICEVNTEGDVTYEQLAKIDYLNRCINESLRLYPPAPRVDRVASKDITINGVDVPKGMIVNILIYVLHHDPDYWPNPEHFDPDRFDPENMTETQKNAFIPFGSGNRICIASRLAMLELRVAAVKMLKAFRFEKTAETPEKDDLKYLTKVAVIAPDVPLKLAAVRRS